MVQLSLQLASKNFYPQGRSVNTIQLGWSSVRSTNWTQVKFSQCLMAYKKIYYVYYYKLKVRWGIFKKKCQVISFLEFWWTFFERIKELKKLRQRLGYSSLACKSSWILITSLDLWKIFIFDKIFKNLQFLPKFEKSGFWPKFE